MEEKIKLIIQGLTEGKTRKEMLEVYGIESREIDKFWEVLKNPKSEFYNLELREQMKDIQKINAKKKNAIIASKHKKKLIFDTSLKKVCGAIEYIKTRNASIEKASLQFNVLAEKICEELEQSNDEKLRGVLEQFKEKYKGLEDKKIREYPQNVQEEIILMALTYRLSFVNMTRIFKTTIDDILAIYENFRETHSRFLLYLAIETDTEDKQNEYIACAKAKVYFQKRNKIIKQLNETTEEEKKEELKSVLRELHTEIDDAIVLGTIGKKTGDLTEVEQDAIARYRVKYSLGLVECKTILKRDRETIRNYESNLAEKNIVFREKLEFLNTVKDEHYNILASNFGNILPYDAEINKGR